MRRISVSELYFPREYRAIEELLEELDIKPMTDIWIYSRYPRGWDAVVGFGKNKVLVMIFNSRTLLYDVEYYQCHGFRENGTLIFS